MTRLSFILRLVFVEKLQYVTHLHSLTQCLLCTRVLFIKSLVMTQKCSPISHVAVRGGDDRQPHVGQTQMYSIVDVAMHRPPFLHGCSVSHMVTSMNR